jgi:glycosyltransferase involved in cell wall biosynthesis
MALKVLFIGNVWPEPTSSAAGLRTLNLLDACLAKGFEAHFVSPCKDNEFRQAVTERGVATEIIQPNDSRFDVFVAALKPDYVIFDRFMIEEQFGWRVQKFSPESVRVLDTIDLHLLRRARERAIKAGGEPELLSDDALREMASIYRSDLTLVISSFEMALLKEKFKIPAELLTLLRFFYDPPKANIPSFEERQNFTMIGNFRHAPNLDAVFWMHREIWPKIRAKLPKAELHLYGAYPPKEAIALDDAATGFRVRGWAEDQYRTLATYRVNLAALRYGAGIKGKITDGWWCGTPVVATPVAFEGMSDGLPWGGEVAESADQFAEAAVKLYEDLDHWKASQARGDHIMQTLYDRKRGTGEFLGRIDAVRKDLTQLRATNLVGQMLWHQGHRSTEYFSRWIELKNS